MCEVRNHRLIVRIRHFPEQLLYAILEVLMPRSLESLPSELLSHVVSYFDTVWTLSCLALTCRKLNLYIQSNDGYRAFVQSRYPSSQTPPYWKDAVHGLTTLSRAWDHKSLLARCIQPPSTGGYPPPHTQNRRPHGQTMGYQPIIDSYESWTGLHWTSRRQIVAWGAGAELILRVKWMGRDVDKEWQSARARKESTKEFDQHHHRSRWWRVTDSSYKDGRDDITAIRLLRDSQKPLVHCEYVIVGRASGELDMVSIHHEIPNAWKKEIHFKNEGQNIRSISVDSTEQPLLAVCVGDRTIAIYSVSAGHNIALPLGKIHLTPVCSSEEHSWVCFTVFLRHDRLAVSFGPSIEPIQIFKIRFDAIPSHPIRTFSMHEKCREGVTEIRRGMVNVLVPLPQLSVAGRSEGDLFLSGGHDGVIR